VVNLDNVPVEYEEGNDGADTGEATITLLCLIAYIQYLIIQMKKANLAVLSLTFFISIFHIVNQLGVCLVRCHLMGYYFIVYYSLSIFNFVTLCKLHYWFPTHILVPIYNPMGRFT